MLLCFMGASCTGKSTAAEKLSEINDWKVYTGKEYLKLAKNAGEAAAVFNSILQKAALGEDNIIYVVSELRDLELIPKQAYRVLFTAELGVMKQRFAERMHGNLPPAVSAMLERKAVEWSRCPHDLLIESHLYDIAETVEIIRKSLKTEA